MPSGLAIDLAPEGGFDWHEHDQHQLAAASKGVLVMGAEASVWVLPRSRALWIPAGVRHSVATAGTTTMLSIYVEPTRCPITWTEPTAVVAGDLIVSLLSYLVTPELDDGARRRAEAVLWDVLVPLPVTTLPTPMPRDERARRVADALRADPTDGRSLAEWGREVGASSRTLARLFIDETGMGFERWRTHVRLGAALPRLAAGEAVANVARLVGYTTPSGFVAAFRREIGTTPAEYFHP
jgi:AraC-like DNA-binding protein